MHNTKDLAAEQELVEQAKSDPHVFGLIFDRYYSTILRYAIRRTGDVHIAEDIVAETFMKALKKLSLFRWRGVSIEAWLFAIATNEIRMHYRRRQFNISLDDLFEREGVELADKTNLEAEAQEAQNKLLRRHQFVEAQLYIAALPIKYQEVLVLRFAQNKKIAEIAEILGKREGTIKSIISRSIVKLRNKMQPKHQNDIVVSEGHNKP